MALSVQPSYETAKTARHKARLAGVNRQYWYPAEWSNRVKAGQVSETRFWGESIALFRGKDGTVGAVENRCAHRNIPLTIGHVRGCDLVCLYHGWSFAKDGRLTGMQHDYFGKRLPKIRIRRYPVRERYGLIWIFPGDPELADAIPLPDIANADGPDAWAKTSFDFTWRAHHYLVIDNLCNLTHLHVHGNWVPYEDTILAHYSLENERIRLVWHHTLRRDLLYPISAAVFRKERSKNESESEMFFDYPYHSTTSNNCIRSCNFMLPMAPDETRVFTIQLWDGFRIPLTQKRVPASVMGHTWVPLIEHWSKEVFRQDGATVEAEQSSLFRHWNQPIPEPNPSVKLFESLIIDRWEKQLAYERGEISAREASPGMEPKRV